jgi:hypothetical protein
MPEQPPTVLTSLSAREAELAVRAEDLRRREEALERREADLERRIREFAERRLAEPRVSGIGATLARRAAAIGAAPSAFWTLAELERLVAEHAVEFPERVEEWRAYLSSLPDVADPAGRLPSSLDPLLDEVFAPFGGVPRGR